MRRLKRNGSFLVTLLINMLLNLEWTIPAWILLALHYIIDLPIWPFWLALGLWIVSILLWMKIIGWASRCGSIPDKPKENKNPYSSRNSRMMGESKREED